MSGIELPNRLRDLLTKKIRDKAPWYPSSTWLFDDNVGSATYPRDAVEVARTVVEELMKTAPENITEVWLLREVSTPMTVLRLWPSAATGKNR